MTSKIHNVNVVSKTNLPTPADIGAALPMSERAEATVVQSREMVRDIIDGRDGRLFAVVGPCSIHDVEAAHEYAGRLRDLAAELAGSLFILM
ncbi:MAG: 3-deoxy-7-phosphoheptulonate synthase, partial [Gammaproteobacteria bacterium]